MPNLHMVRFLHHEQLLPLACIPSPPYPPRHTLPAIPSPPYPPGHAWQPMTLVLAA